MGKAFREARSFWFGYLVLLLVGALLGLRCEKIVAAVLNTQHGGATVATSSEKPGFAESVMISKKDSLLQSVGTPVRDPFGFPAPEVKRRAPVKHAVKPDIPSLSSLLYVDGNSSAQLVVGGEKSGWLAEGESFQGWKVVKIDSQSVRVAKDGRLFNLRSQ